MNGKVLAVIVTYNRKDMLKQSIEHIFAQDHPCDILIVDNASTDGTIEWAASFAKIDYPCNTEQRFDKNLTASFGEVRLLYENTGANLGGAGGFNYGIKRAYELEYSYVWIMDDDAFVHTDTLSELFKIDKLLGGPENYGYLASTVLWTDGTECKMNRHRIFRRYYEDFDKLKYGIIPVETSTFVSMLIPMSTVIEVGLPIKEYFIWGDDVEYTMRITTMFNKKSYMVGNSILTHAMKQNIGSDISIDDLNRIPNYKRAFRNENHTYRQYGTRGFLRYVMRCGAYGLRVLKDSKDHRFLRCSIIISRFFAGFFFNPKTEFVDGTRKKLKGKVK